MEAKLAVLWRREKEGIRCNLCARKCLILPGKRGFCMVRENKNNQLYTLNYGRVVGLNFDPIEKKPLFHFYPGSTALSYACRGCNWRCQFCCNWLISHDGLPEIFGDKYEPEEIVEMAQERNCKIISHTYTEPTIYFEFAYEVAKLAHKKGMLNTFVTNGYMSLQALRKISKFLDAATVDFKASNDPSFLLKYSSVPSNEPVFEFLKGLKKYGIHIEITNLIVPQIGENLEQFRKVVKWIIENLGSDVPFHVLRFHPDYMLTEIPVTPIETLESFIEEAKKLGLKHVYIGNVPGHRYENTYCPNCNELLIERTGFWVEKVNLEGNKCKKCGEKINIVV